MEPKTMELVALAASVAGHCQQCFRAHLEKARQLGVDEEDITRTIDLAKRISGVGDQRMAEYIDSVLSESAKDRT